MDAQQINAHLTALRPALMKAARAHIDGSRTFDVKSAAEDVVQEVMIEAWRKNDLDEWKMRKLLTVRCLNFLRNDERRSFIACMDMDSIAREEEKAVDDDASYRMSEPHWPDILNAIRHLQPLIRKAMVMHYLVGEAQHDIAVQEGVSDRMIRMRLMEGRRLVKGILIDTLPIFTTGGE